MDPLGPVQYLSNLAVHHNYETAILQAVQRQGAEGLSRCPE